MSDRQGGRAPEHFGGLGTPLPNSRAGHVGGMSLLPPASAPGLPSLLTPREDSAKLAAELSQGGVLRASAHATLLVYATGLLLLEHMRREARQFPVRMGFGQSDLAVLVRAPAFTLVQPVTPIAREIALQDDLPTPAFLAWSQGHQEDPDLALTQLNAQAAPHVHTRAAALLALTYAHDCARGHSAGLALRHAQDVAWRATGTTLRPRWTCVDTAAR